MWVLSTVTAHGLVLTTLDPQVARLYPRCGSLISEPEKGVHHPPPQKKKNPDNLDGHYIGCNINLSYLGYLIREVQQRSKSSHNSWQGSESFFLDLP